MSTAEPTGTATSKKWYQRFGPGLITACVVIGPGSILTSSQVGAKNGFALTWVVVAAVAFMLVYMQMGAKLGVVSAESAGTLVAQRAGRWLAVLIGLAVFFISASFQFGNNLGVHSAFKVYVDFDYMIILFNALAIGFLFLFHNLYRAVERLMMCFVGLMLASFALNLIFALRAMPSGVAESSATNGDSLLDISLLALVGTTFVITAGFYQSYLVQQKGWSKEELKDGVIDARVGAVLMALITLMIMCTAAAALRGKTLSNVDDVAQQLAPLFGVWGRPVFCLGLFAAAFSSFLVNSMIGGFILADGLGLGSRPTDLAPRILTTVVLLTGMGMALLVIKAGFDTVPAIVAAQAVTVLASPLIAGALLWLTNKREIMGDDCNGPVVNTLGVIGFLLLLAMSWYTATVKIPDRLEKWRETKKQSAQNLTEPVRQTIFEGRSGDALTGR